MYRLLFAEDEKATREGILDSINWKELGISEVRAAKNGAVAMEILKEFVPDAEFWRTITVTLWFRMTGAAYYMTRRTREWRSR